MATRVDSGKSDADLVAESLLGAKEPFAELVTRHWDTAVALAARVLGTAELARDAAQEAAVSAMTGLDRLRSPERFGAWFCGIALNVARRWLRQLRSEPPSIGTLILGTKCTVRRNDPDGPTTHLAWTTKTVGEGDAFFHRKSDIEPGDIITFSLSSGGKGERTVDVVSTSLDGQSKRVIWRVPGGVPSALALNDLHSEVQKAAGSLYRSGHFAEAIGAATKALEVAVRDRTGLPSKNLMGSAFGDRGLLDVRQHRGETGDAEQEGFRFLFMGAARALRNPRAHEFIDDDSVSAMEHLALVSLLLRRLDSATAGRAAAAERARNQAL